MKSRLLMLVTIPLAASVHAGPADVAAAADRLLSEELPKMEAAVVAKDQSYFASGLERVQRFVNDYWDELDKSPACTEAVSDFLIVGQCRIAPPGTLCEPETFFPKFEGNLAKCREAAKASQSLLLTPPAREN